MYIRILETCHSYYVNTYKLYNYIRYRHTHIYILIQMILRSRSIAEMRGSIPTR